MKTAIRENRFHSARLPSSQWRGWKQILPIRDERGITTVVVALFLVIILLFMALLIDGAGMIIRREQLVNLTELAAAAGGRVVAETIAYAAGVRQPNPTPEQKEHPEAVIKSEDRAAIEDGSYPLPDTTVGEAARTEIKKYALLNSPVNLNFNPDTDLNISYVPETNDCADPDQKKVAVSVGARATYPFVFGGFLKSVGLSDFIPIAATSTYQIVICP